MSATVHGTHSESCGPVSLKALAVVLQRLRLMSGHSDSRDTIEAWFLERYVWDRIVSTVEWSTKCPNVTHRVKCSLCGINNKQNL